MLSTKEFLGVLSGALSVVGYVPYMCDILKGRTRPHIFSWVIWTLVVGVAFAAQVFENAGPGSWAAGLVCIICAVVVVLTFKKGDRSVTRGDWISFVLGLAAIPVWRMMDDPLWAVVLVLFVYAMAYYPTFRKSYSRPHEETLFMYVVGAIGYAVSVLAMENFMAASLFFPLGAVAMDVVFITMVVWRRRVLGPAVSAD